MDLIGLATGAVEEDGQEADGDVEKLARYFMSVDLFSVSVAHVHTIPWTLTKDLHS